jgi:hypothetical protein
MRRRIARVAVVFVMAASMFAGSASAAHRRTRIPPPPVPGLRALPTLRLPLPGDRAHVTRTPRRVVHRAHRHVVHAHKRVVHLLR